MIADTISSAARVMLDRRIAEEGLTAINPPFQRPDWIVELNRFSFVPLAFVMTGDGVVGRRRVLADEINWHSIVAVRFETPLGNSIDLADLCNDEDYD